VNDFLGMGGYALYVWGSYAAALAVFAWNVLAPWRERARLLRQLRQLREGRDAGAGA
jgi:heme exporter protein D